MRENTYDLFWTIRPLFLVRRIEKVQQNGVDVGTEK